MQKLFQYRNYNRCLLLLVCLFILLFGQARLIFATENSAPFVVRTENSPYQVDQSKSYFDLRLPAKQKVALTVQIHNVVDYPVKISVSVNQATTNLNGFVEYGPSNNKLASNLPFVLKSCVTIDQPELIIPAKETITTTVYVTIADDQFAGVVAGGLTFLDVTHEKQGGDTAFNNRFAYTVAILLHGALPALENQLSILTAKMSEMNQQQALLIQLANQRANYLNQLQVQATLYNSKQQAVLKLNKKQLQMAPNSLVSLPFFLENNALSSGSYRLKIVAMTPEAKWQKVQTLQIKSSPIPTLAGQNQDQNPVSGQLLWILIIFLVLCIFILIGIILYLMLRKNKKQV
ncbi:WxL protein peptidoglycan domain-containing protein [Enterococcus columbae]|uniref:Uncharacterized protein n=1 Tax=Enterococcus columbae DSM 7374 = ATCC 51263 TaxID=1121865 RepID=S0KPA5_9ENTE|nr:DUF916 domain-containing protein [Enterococcus columbae]EOT41026.1 hypothetical protein OMW_01268 [Enterococcus columbae DSM 7374 = ATCC 51263]EOW80706.1 hypothetical protein I568_01884 [Enterococcus columbae DSM 7374 = ATCC 51263]